MATDSIIKEARNLSKKGLTQVQIARKLNKSQSYISNILKKWLFKGFKIGKF